MRHFSRSPWRQLREGVYVATLEPTGVTVGLVAGTDAVLLVDTGSSPAQGADVAASAHELLGRPVTHVVVTHWHFDHFFGLAGVPDVVSYGHESLRGKLGSGEIDPDVVRDELGVDLAELVPPTDDISIVKALDLGGRRVEIVHPGRAHSDGDLVVYVPDARVVFTGDLIETSAEPSVGPDSSLASWSMALDGLLSGAGHAPDLVFVPGHGEPVGAMEVAEQQAALASMWASSEDRFREGVTLEEIVADFNGPRRYSWPFAPQHVVDILPFVYAELERRGVTRRRGLPISSV
ncbi:MAG TPA: MBL fold metallo-hydrolase [Propionibacteriaceae bacterium]|nr:MBL fold metallo-hydrolase [Propionibacteriaceae bacterium]